MRWSMHQSSWKKFTNTKVKLAQLLLYQEMITETLMVSLVILIMLQQVKNPLDWDAVLLLTCILRIDSPVLRKLPHILSIPSLKQKDAWGLTTPAQILLTRLVLILKIWSNTQFQRALPKSLDKDQHLDQFAAQRSTKAVMRLKMEETDTSLVNTIAILRHAP